MKPETKKKINDWFKIIMFLIGLFFGVYIIKVMLR
jgi:hypothetical protein